MHESTRLMLDHVMGPYGPLTAVNLPTPDTKRWNVRRKAEVVAAVLGGLLTLEEAFSRYALNAEEFLSWQYCIDRYGLKGLRTIQHKAREIDAAPSIIPQGRSSGKHRS
jgi:uncharacterized protein DUF1153